MAPAFDPDEIRDWDKATSAPNPTLGAYGGLLPFDASVRHRFPNRVVTEGWGQVDRYAEIQGMFDDDQYYQIQPEADFQHMVVSPFVSAHRVRGKERNRHVLASTFAAPRPSEGLPTGGSMGGVFSRGRVDLTTINMRPLYGSDLWNDIEAVRQIRMRNIASRTSLQPAEVNQSRVDVSDC